MKKKKDSYEANEPTGMHFLSVLALMRERPVLASSTGGYSRPWAVRWAVGFGASFSVVMSTQGKGAGSYVEILCG